MKLKDTIEVAILDDGNIIAVNEEYDMGKVAIAGSIEDFDNYVQDCPGLPFPQGDGGDLPKGKYILLKAVGTLEVK